MAPSITLCCFNLPLTHTSRHSLFVVFTSRMCLWGASHVHNHWIKGSRTHLQMFRKLVLASWSPLICKSLFYHTQFSFWILCQIWTAQIMCITLPQARPSYYLICLTCPFCIVQFWDIVPPLPVLVLWQQNILCTVRSMEGDWRHKVEDYINTMEKVTTAVTR